MAAFIFPNPADQTTVENPITGVKYEWKEDSGKWVITTAHITASLDQAFNDLAEDVSDNKLEIAQHDTRLDSLEAKPVAKDYMLGTDKSPNRNAPASTGPQIELVDSEGYFSNVKFEATGGLAVSSSVSSIIFDGSNIDADLDDYYTKTEVNNIVDTLPPAVNPDNYYTKAESDVTTNGLQIQINDLAVTKGAASVYTLNDIGVIVGIRPGDFYIDNTVAKNISFITLSPIDNNGNDRPLGTTGDILELVGLNNKHYRYKITTAGEGVAGVEFITAEDPDDLLIPGTTFQIFIYPQNSASASVEYVDAGLATKLPKSGGLMTGDVVMGGSANQIMTNSSYIRFGWGDVNTSEEYGGYVYMRNADTFEIGAYADKTLKFIGEPLFEKSPEVPTPTLDSHAASKYYVDNQIGGLQSSIGDYLPLTGGTLTGNLHLDTGSGLFSKEIIKSTRGSGYAFQCRPNDGDTTLFLHTNGSFKLQGGEFNNDVTFDSNVSIGGGLTFTNGGTINVSSGGTVLSGRASLDIKTAADYPVVISSGSSYKKVVAIYGYDGNEDDNRGEVASINANGNAYFNTVYSNDEELATQTYAKDLGQIYYGNIVPAGSDVNDGDLWVDSGNMRLLMRASGAWVNPDREADTDSFKANANPNGRKFGFSSGTAAVTGKLNYYDSSGLKLRLSNTDAFGIKWNDGGITQDVTTSSGPYFTITEVVDDTNHKIIRQGRVSRIDYHAGDILCHLSSHRTNGGFDTSKQYWVNIGGII